jgi:hypothetical protein
MSEWISRVQDHRVWAAMNTLGTVIDQAAKVEDITPDAAEALERLRAVLALVGKRLGGTDPLTIFPAPLDGLAAAFESQKAEIETYIGDHNVIHLTNANTNADSALANYLAQIPGTASSEELIGIVRTVGSHRSALEEQERLSLTARREAKRQIEELTTTLEGLKAQTQSSVAELKALLEAEKQKMATQATEQQKQFTDAQTTRSNTFNDTLLKVQENLTKTITDQQGQFSTAQDNRSREFTTAQADAQKRLSDLLADYTKRFADQDAEFTRQRDVFTSTAQGQLTALNETYEKGAKKILDQVDNHRKDVEKLVGVIGNLGVTSGYQKTANTARNSMWFWNAVAVLAMCGLIFFAYHAFLPTMQGDFRWGAFAGRVFLTITVGVLAAYAASQADRFFKMEKYHRKLALELAAIDPFIALLPLDEQQKFKLEIGRRSFAQEETPSLVSDKSPATTLDVLASKEGQQIVQTITDTIQTVAKGITKAAS